MSPGFHLRVLGHTFPVCLFAQQYQINFVKTCYITKPFRHSKIQKIRKIGNYFPSVNCRNRCSMEKGVLRNFTKFTGKHLCQSFRSANLLNKRLWHRCFTVNFAKFLRTPFLQNTSGRLLLNLSLRS